MANSAEHAAEAGLLANLVHGPSEDDACRRSRRSKSRSVVLLAADHEDEASCHEDAGAAPRGGYRSPMVVRSQAPGRHWSAGSLLGVALVGVVGTALAISMRAHHWAPGAVAQGAVTSEVEVASKATGGELVCSTPAAGQDCLKTKCCMDGGDKGYQCYEKKKGYGQCFPVGTCKTGVHKGEKHGVWNASGVFVLDSWSCKEVGNASKPGCSSYSKKECPADRCGSVDDECKVKCSTVVGGAACEDQAHCMVDGGACKDACSTFEVDDCEAVDRCMLDGGKCKAACHVHSSQDDCPHKDKCMWQGGKCEKDPCSAAGEDCSKTQCCSAARFAAGMTCFEKDKDYAECLEIFDSDAHKNWTGKQLGNRTSFRAGCSWAGDDCSSTKLCCNEGFACAVKDSDFTGCVHAQEVSVWFKKPIPLPAGWNGKRVGGWRTEYQMAPATTEANQAGTSLYCLMAVLPNSTEVDLLQIARKSKTSIFACDDHSVFDSFKTEVSNSFKTLVNTAVFLKVFEKVKRQGTYLQHDWTVKVDADCVFFPDRLRTHLKNLKPPRDTSLYIKNSDPSYLGAGTHGFLGAIEIFSKRAMQIYFDNSDGCAKYLGQDCGEDGFFKGCMDALGAGFMTDESIFVPHNDPSICNQAQYVAYHPIKFPSHWQRCVDLANGCTTCNGPLNPPVPTVR